MKLGTDQKCSAEACYLPPGRLPGSASPGAFPVQRLLIVLCCVSVCWAFVVLLGLHIALYSIPEDSAPGLPLSPLDHAPDTSGTEPRSLEGNT